MTLEIVETTRGSNQKMYTYEVNRLLKSDSVVINGRKVRMFVHKLYADEIEKPVNIKACNVDCRDRDKFVTPCRYRNSLFVMMKR